ncbi:MAG: ribonuclease [Chthoniobacteraceae bacterium]|nr:ribonuclease [Chthoniobacteraceae bacterium]
MNRFLPPAFDLQAFARQTVLALGFAVDMSPEAAAEAAATKPDLSGVRDLRSLHWSSIDNPESRDLDQVEFATLETDGEIRLLIGIADVDALVPRGSHADSYAASNTTSLYTGATVFPMLPAELSNALTSLLENADRLAIVVEFTVALDGAVHSLSVFRAWVRNAAKLDYDLIGDWLEEKSPRPLKVAALEGLESQLRLQDQARARLRAFRHANGALEFESVEARPVTSQGQVVDLKLTVRNQARDLIESFMVATNSVMASFLESKGSLTIQRVVRTPKRWERIVAIANALGTVLPFEPNSRALADFLTARKAADPASFPDLSLAIVKLLGPGEYAVLRAGAEHEGHFGLAVHDYTHSTAPNRRFVDLVTQRLVKAALLGEPAPYSEPELLQIVEHCNERGNAARKAERTMRKAAAAVLLAGRVGDCFDAIVTGAVPRGTFVRLLGPPADGRVVKGEHGLDVGDKVRVRLLSTDPAHGFIDFERLGS